MFLDVCMQCIQGEPLETHPQHSGQRDQFSTNNTNLLDERAHVPLLLYPEGERGERGPRDTLTPWRECVCVCVCVCGGGGTAFTQ